MVQRASREQWSGLTGLPMASGERAGNVRTDAEREEPVEQLAAREASPVIQAYQALHFMMHASSMSQYRRGG